VAYRRKEHILWISFAPRLFVSPRHPWRGGFIQKNGEEDKERRMRLTAR